MMKNSSSSANVDVPGGWAGEVIVWLMATGPFQRPWMAAAAAMPLMTAPSIVPG